MTEVTEMPSVKIRIEKGVETAGSGLEEQEKELSKKQQKQLSIATVFVRQTMGQMKSVFMKDLSRIGERTGDYIKQANINGSLEVVNDIASIASGIALSVTTYNPVPAIMAVASVGIKIGQKYYDIAEEQRHASFQREFLLERSGNATTNGSRGTEN